MSDREIVMVGNSRGAASGEQRTADEDTAAELVRAGLAKYESAEDPFIDEMDDEFGDDLSAD